MARRRRKEGLSISLLPILSIQKCTMGIMVVLICAQNLISVGQTEQALEDAKKPAPVPEKPKWTPPDPRDSAKQDEILDYAGAVRDRHPVFVECTRSGVLIHPDRQEVPYAALEGTDPSPFHTLLDELKDDRQRYLLLLIRPDGIRSFRKCLEMARDREVDVGKDALLADGKVLFVKDGKPMLREKKEKQP